MAQAQALQSEFALTGRLVQSCDYGENRWQSPAGLYARKGGRDPLALDRFEVVAGRTPSYINFTDVDRLLQIVTHVAAGFDLNFGEVPPCIAVAVKHGNACGAAIGHDPRVVLQKMVTGNLRSIHGAVMMTNFDITLELATLLRKHRMIGKAPRLFDGVAAPNIEEKAYARLARKDGKYTLLTNPALANLSAKSLDSQPLVRPVRDGCLVQPNYTHVLDLSQCQLFGDAKPTANQLRDVVFGWAICATSTSNTITLVRGGQLLGNGVGQQDRVGCAELAVKQATESGHNLRGCTAVSDSFFPFDDGLKVLAAALAKTVFSTSGSVNDRQVIATARRYGIKLLMQPDAEARAFARH